MFKFQATIDIQNCYVSLCDFSCLTLLLCIIIGITTTLTEVFPCFFFSCKDNARVKTHKDGARPALFLVVGLFYVFLCCSMYCLFCDVPCIVCVHMCTEQLPPGG
jgi:hypothetical protein